MAKNSKGRVDLNSLVDDLDVSPGNQPAEETGKKETGEKRPSTFSALDRRKEAGTKLAGRVVEIDTDRCRMWQMADRLDEGMSEEALDSLARSIKENQQRVPVIARKVSDESADAEYEIIAGKRRFEACKRAGIPVLVMLKDLSDTEAYTVMLVENDDREDITPFTRALSLRDALDRGIYESQNDLIEKHNETSAHRKYNKSLVSKMLSATKLKDYEFIWREVRRPSEIGVKPAYQLVRHIEAEEGGRVLKVLQDRVARLRSEERIEKMTGSQLILDLLDVAERKLGLREEPKKPAKVSRGNLTAEASRSAKGIRVELGGEVEAAKEADLVSLAKEAIERLMK
jgi:ParB/RepB/Spo0J family partition protein